MEEAVLLGQLSDRCKNDRRDGAWVVNDSLKSAMCDPWSVEGGFGLDERGAPAVGSEFPAGEVGIVLEATPTIGLGADLGEGRRGCAF